MTPVDFHWPKATDRPLLGRRVVSLATNLPRPLAAARLTHLGARVTKVEPPAGDPLQAVAPEWYDELVADQLVTTVDLKTAAGRARLDELLAGSVLLLTSMRPSALERLGLRDLTDRFPRLSTIEIVGYPDDERPGHDLTYQATYGTLDPPSVPRVPAADLIGAERAVTAAVLALAASGASGRGSTHRISLDCAARDAAQALRHGLTAPDGPLGGASPFYRIYPAADGHVALAAIEPHFADRVRDAWGESCEQLTRTFSGAPTTEWDRRAADLDIPLVGVPSTTGSRCAR